MKHDIHCISVFANQGVHHGKYRHQSVQKLAQIFVGLQLTIFKPQEFYFIKIFAVQSMSRQSCYAMCKVLCIFVQRFLLTLNVPVYQNAHVKSVWEKVYCIRCLFYFSSVPLLTFINTKGNMC